MKAAILNGVNQKIEIREFSLDPIDNNKVLVDVNHCSLNHRDLWISKGQYAGLNFPIILGSDVCGNISEREVILNPSLQWGLNNHFQDKSYKILGLPDHGGLAEKVAIYQSNIYDKPSHLTGAQASALPLAGLTAFRALCTRAKLTSSDKVFITGIGGGVALFALQIALSMGAEVFVSSSDDEKLAKAIALGAKVGYNYKNVDWHKEFLSQNSGVDVIIDGAGGADFGKLVKIANPGARITLYGATRGTWQDIIVQQVFWKQLNIMGSTMGSDDDFVNFLNLINEKKIVPIVDRVFPLSEINEALVYMDQGLQFGKIVITINE